MAGDKGRVGPVQRGQRGQGSQRFVECTDESEGDAVLVQDFGGETSIGDETRAASGHHHLIRRMARRGNHRQQHAAEFLFP